MRLNPAGSNMGEVARVRTRGGYQRISKESIKWRLIWPLGHLK